MPIKNRDRLLIPQTTLDHRSPISTHRSAIDDFSFADTVNRHGPATFVGKDFKIESGMVTREPFRRMKRRMRWIDIEAKGYFFKTLGSAIKRRRPR